MDDLEKMGAREWLDKNRPGTVEALRRTVPSWLFDCVVESMETYRRLGSAGQGEQYSVSYELLHEIWQLLGRVPQGVPNYDKYTEAYLKLNSLLDNAVTFSAPTEKEG